MNATTHPRPLACELAGSGTPVVLLHGLTFDRRTWRPIVERLAGAVRTIAVDLPAHGESGGVPAPLDDIAVQLHDLLSSLDVERPVVVGHSMMGGLACLYAAAHPTRGIVLVDSGLDVQPFAELVHRLEPALRGPAFAEVWPAFERTLGIERIPEPWRSLVLDAHVVKQDVVVGYWETILRRTPAATQAWIDDEVLPKLATPCLAVFGRAITPGERARFARLPDVRLEEWAGEGHFVHLVDPGRFAIRLQRFVDECGA